MDNFSYPAKGVYGYKSLHWALNNFIQANHEFESLPTWSEDAIEKHMDAVEAAVYVMDLLEAHLSRHGTK